jgi:mono/diheme cytochrome c family protein
MQALARLVFALAFLTGASAAHAAEPTLVISADGATRQWTAAALLANPDTKDLTVDDVAYGRPMTYRAVPLLALLKDFVADRSDTLEAQASDGFATQIPLTLITAGASGGAVAWVAVEDPAHPWPVLPHVAASAGPFYLVWEHARHSNVRTEQWPYALASLTFTESPAHRWPQLAAPGDLPANAPARRGQEVFVIQCLPCHRLNGGGAGDMGPDLGRPMNATHYLSEAGLRAIIRNPRAVRTWPSQQMVGFDQTALPEADLDAVVAYLQAVAAVGAK